MKRRIAAILLAPFVGAFLGYILVIALNNGWLNSKWQLIEKPPGEGLQLAALSRDSLWMRNATGKIYYNENASTCHSDCWQEVSGIPTLPILRSDETVVNGEACAPSLPLSRVTDRISECRSTMWVDYDFMFALRNDGSIYLWQADLYKEWAVILLITGVCTGALALFIPTLLIVLVLGLRARRIRYV